jgi:ATP/maltotriose-dependent transcriptional regulator MalT
MTPAGAPAAHLPAQVVSRPRLHRALGTSTARLVIVTGPAGSGKTVAVRDWLTGVDGPTAWLPLAARHTDPEVFLDAVLSALESLVPGLIDAVQRDDPDDYAADLAIVRAAEHLASAGRVTLVLDDLHVIDRSPTAGLLARLVEAAPANLRVVICSRSDPPIRLHRYRLAGELVELREADLRFDRGEAEQFFAQFPRVDLAGEQIERLTERTEGWAAGLQFAALSLAGRDDPGAFVDRFTGSDRHVADFLLDEVLVRQPGQVRDFLLATSVLERLRGDLCEAVTGRPDAAALLRRVETENLFLVALDDEREWFRYHHLFGQLLRRELRVTHPDVEQACHERAAAWFRDHGEPGLAIDHLLDAGQLEQAFELLTANLRDYLRAGRQETVRGWLNRFPTDFVDETPGHQLLLILAFARAGQIDRGALVVQRARRRSAERDGDAYAIHLDVTEAAFAAIMGDPDTAARLGAEAWERRGEVDVRSMPPDLGTAVTELWGYLPAALARAHALLDDRAGVRRWSSVLRRQGPRLPGDLVGALGAEAWAEARNGRLRAAAELADQALVLGTEHGRGSRRAMIGARAALALIHREQDELDRAIEVLEPHLDAALREGHVAITTVGEAELARAECAQSRPGDAIARVLRVRRDRAARGTPRFLVNVLDQAECRVRVALGELDRAEDLLEDLDGGPERTLLAARVALAAGRPGGVADQLAPLLADNGDRRRRREAAALAARALVDEADPAGARRVLAEVAELAQREGAVRVFLDEGFDIFDVVGGEVVARPVRAPGSPLVEPLSEREMSVLRYLPSRLSNREIGAELYVSLNTVKSHLKTIYRKLEVERRDDAVRRARQLGLI